MTAIVKVIGREVMDSRGNPTVEADVVLASGVIGRACAPSVHPQAPVKHLNFRDHDVSRYLGKGVLNAVANVNWRDR
jgi:enolase